MTCEKLYTNYLDVLPNLLEVSTATKNKTAYLKIAIPNELAEEIIKIQIAANTKKEGNFNIEKLKLFLEDKREREKINEQN